MMSLGRAHRLYLLNRLDRLERQGATWTTEEVADCITMEHKLDYLEARGAEQGETAPSAPATTSKAAGPPPAESRGPGTMEGDPPNAEGTTTAKASGAPPQEAAKEELQHGTTSSSTGASSTAPPTATAAGRPEAPAGHNDPPQDHSSGPTTSPESADTMEAESGEVPLPPTNSSCGKILPQGLLSISVRTMLARASIRGSARNSCCSSFASYSEARLGGLTTLAYRPTFD